LNQICLGIHVLARAGKRIKQSSIRQGAMEREREGGRERGRAKKGRSEGRKRDGQKECSKEEVDEAETQVFSLMRNS
jgi:hypothetical protein